MDLSEAIERSFGAAASAYAKSAVHAEGPDMAALLAAAELTGAERVLDLGCGPGHTAFAFAPRASRVVGLDLSEAMLAEARRLASERGLANLRFERGDAARLPFEDACFEVVTCRQSAHHYGELSAALSEVARVLVPGGRFLLVDSIAPEAPQLDTFLNAIELLRDPTHVRNHRLSEWHGMLRTVGLAPETLQVFQLDIAFEPWLERVGTPAPARAALRALLDGATDEVRCGFALRPGSHDWSLPCALVRGRRMLAETG